MEGVVLHSLKTTAPIGGEEAEIKDADFQKIGNFYLDRLKGIIARAVPYGMPFLNSRNSPLYWLCFAAGNPRGAPRSRWAWPGICSKDSVY
jgi:hypothetical protein